MIGFGHLFHQDITKVVINVCPRIDNLIVTLGISDESHIIILGNLMYLFISPLYDCIFLLGNNDVIKVERKTCHISHPITQVLDSVEELTRTSHTYILDYICDDAT